MQKLLNWLKGLFLHPKDETPVMSEENEVVDPQPVATDNTDAVLAKLKELLKVAGHDVESVFDDVVALAKKLAL